MTPQEMTELRDKRVLAAMNLEKPDRIPIMLTGQAFFKWIDPKLVMADIFRRQEFVDELTIQAFQLPVIDEMDSGPIIGYPTIGGLEAFAAMFFAKIKIPGRDLGEDALWNIDEQGPMTVEDYDTVIDKGWEYVTTELYKRIGFNPENAAIFDMEYFGKMMGKAAVLGKSTISIGGDFPFPSFEVLSGARKLPEFFKDLRRIPDKVKAAIEIIDESANNRAVDLIKNGPPSPIAFIGGTRSGSDFISAKVYEQYYHSYYRKIVPTLQELNVKAYLHNDSNWDGFMHYFTEFPKASCVWAPDQLSSQVKAREALGSLMCIQGDVPPALLAVGTPDDCYKYAKELIDIHGKDGGFIMAAGCSVPPNAKRENVEAVILAALGK